MACPDRRTDEHPSEASPPATTRRSERAADAVWRRLCDGLTASWLDEIRGLRADEDDFEVSLDIWSVALTAELKDPQRREVAAAVLGRLQQLSDAADG